MTGCNDDGQSTGSDITKPEILSFEWSWSNDYSSAVATTTYQGQEIVLNASVSKLIENKATCRTKGSIRYTASVKYNDQYYTNIQREEVDELGHEWTVLSWNWKGFDRATANLVCARDKSHKTAIVTSVDKQIEGNPCEGIGKNIYTATIEKDGYTFSDTKSEEATFGHKIVYRQAVAPTCTEIGYEEGSFCERCNVILEGCGEIAALGHLRNDSYSFDDDGHWDVCLRCESVLSEKYAHTLTGTDTCVSCEYYIPDTLFPSSAIKSVVRRVPISSDFENKAGLSSGTLEIVVIDIAQGDSIFIKFPDNQTMLMDGGSVNFPIGNHYDRIKAVLDSYNVKTLNHLFITHSDYDHVRYLEDVLDDFQVENIYMPKVSDNSNGSTWKDLVKAIQNETYVLGGVSRKTNIRYNIGEFEIAGECWRMRCYTYLSKDYPVVNGSSASSPTAPDADDDEILNSLSPICFLEYAGRVVVLTGDSNQFNESYLVDRGIFDGVKADILKVAHHGSKTSTTDKFLSAFECNYAIISYGTNVFGHPTNEVLSRLDAHGYKYIYETKKDGNVRVDIYGNGALKIDAVKTDDRDITEEYDVIINQDYMIVTVARKKEEF
ncbi:MAG: MBL fold metallo-hydrolase [Clostridia bacterium]|nr:MBL fold metallo-hydrolase [Clostridia bacterium]